MGEVLDRAQLVDVAALGDRAIGVTIPRSQVEDVLRSEGTPELVLEMARGDNGDDGPTAIHLEWNAQELEQLLGRIGDAGDLALLFDRDDIERLIDEDVEAHGLRERAAVLAVAATAATAAVGTASAQPIVPVHDGGGGAATIEMVSDAATSGPADFAAGPASVVSDAALSGPQATTGPIQSAAGLEAIEESVGPSLVSDSASSGPVELAAGPSSLISDSAMSGPQSTPGPIQSAAGLEALEATATTESASLVSDAALSGPQSTPASPVQSAAGLEALEATATPSTVAVASGGGSSDEGISMPSPATTGAIAAGAALALSAAFVVRRRRPDDTLRPA